MLGWYHRHRLELARGCVPILEDLQLHHDWWAEFGLGLSWQLGGDVTRSSERRGFTFELHRASSNVCSLNKWLLPPGQKTGMERTAFLLPCKAPNPSRWHPAVWLTKGREVWGQFHAGPYSVFSPSPLGRLPHVQNL